MLGQVMASYGEPLAAHMYTCHNSARSTCITRYGLLWKVYGWTNGMLCSGYLRCALNFRSACLYGPRGLCAIYYSQRVQSDLDRPRVRCCSSCSFFCCHCHSTSTGKNCHRSNSGHRHLRNTMDVFSWACHSMKSLSRSTPEVRISKSRGGASAVIMLSFRVWALMDSGSRNVGPFCMSSFSDELMAVEVDEERPSSTEAASLDEGDAGRESACSATPSVSSSNICLRMCWVMWDSEKVRFEGVGRLCIGVLYVSTVFMTAVVIS
jgi:hypothetical protein